MRILDGAGAAVLLALALLPSGLRPIDPGDEGPAPNPAHDGPLVVSIVDPPDAAGDPLTVTVLLRNSGNGTIVVDSSPHLALSVHPLGGPPRAPLIQVSGFIDIVAPIPIPPGGDLALASNSTIWHVPEPEPAGLYRVNATLSFGVQTLHATTDFSIRHHR